MMRRRSRLLVVAACLALVGALMAATPAAAVQPFGPVVTVTQPGCSFGAVSGDSVVGSDGIVRGFVEFEGGGCGTGRVIHYIEGAGGSWTSTPSPYRGIVLGVAWDGTATYLLYAANDGIRITKRTAAGFTAGRRISSRGLGGAVVPSGDVVAAGGNWWAVWTEQVGPGGEFAQTDLFQALTLGQGHFHNGIGRQRITANPLWDGDPSLTMAPGGGSAGQVVLAWTRDDGPRGERSAIRFAKAAFDGHWTSQAFGAQNPASSPDLFTYGPQVFVAYAVGDHIIAANNPPSGVVSNRFLIRGHGPRVGSSAGRTFVGWTSRSGHVVVGEATAPGVHTDQDLTPTAGPQQLLAISGRAGKATVLAVSFGTHRLWASTQS
jgi:hypothetical protein